MPLYMDTMDSPKPCFRESEIQIVLDMLDSGGSVAILGKYGAGKSSFMNEFHRYCREKIRNSE